MPNITISGVRKRRRLFIVLVVMAIVFIGILIALYSMRSRSVLFSNGAKADTFGEPSISIFNPFRNRSPERSAEMFLEALKARQCDQVIALLPMDEEYRRYVCGKESEHPLDSWTLKNRLDELEKVKLFYWHWRTDSDTHDRLWITVEKRDEQWHVTNYECIY